MINIRQKGADGERQIADHLNLIVNTCYIRAGLPVPLKPIVQRNQNQSAVGGQDLVGTFGLAIEVKRQEQLSIGTWWKQCEASAKTLGEIPVLLFRQNKQSWRCVTNGFLPTPTGSSQVGARVEISFDDFSTWFRHIVNGAIVQLSAQRAMARPVSGEGLFD